MFDFQALIQESWKWMLAALVSIVSAIHWKEQRRIESRVDTKVSKDVYEAEKKVMLSPLEKKIDRIETYLRLLLDKNDINYHD